MSMLKAFGSFRYCYIQEIEREGIRSTMKLTRGFRVYESAN
jgi:hypothetical protein